MAPVWNQDWELFCSIYGFTPIACQKRTPECKGKVERSVQYVKKNCLVGKSYKDFDDLNEQVRDWCLNVADHRPLKRGGKLLGTPIERFKLEQNALQKFVCTWPRIREEFRKVDKTGIVQLDGNLYKVPDIARSRSVRLKIEGSKITVDLTGKTIAVLAKDAYIKNFPSRDYEKSGAAKGADKNPQPSANSGNPNPIGRPMSEYEKLMGGNWNGKQSH